MYYDNQKKTTIKRSDAKHTLQALKVERLAQKDITIGFKSISFYKLWQEVKHNVNIRVDQNRVYRWYHWACSANWLFLTIPIIHLLLADFDPHLFMIIRYV